MSSVTTLTLTKHHGLGNDFLVLLDLNGAHPGLDAVRLARQACDRHRGIGADGLIVVTRPGPDAAFDADVAMELRNADGSRAEMSGNGIRCLAQAVLDAGAVTGEGVRVATDAGVRVVQRRDGSRPGFMRLSVDMGPVNVIGEDPRWVTGTVAAAAVVETGNPHLVLLDPEMEEVDLAREGLRIESAFPEGINVEWIWPGPGPGELTLRVWERGAGVTEACGTGSCAAAAAAHAWGRVGRRVVVHNPGGDVTVEVGDTFVLTGPAALIGTVELLWH
jgi:diaminopimelate epimerase